MVPTLLIYQDFNIYRKTKTRFQKSEMKRTKGFLQ